MGNTVFYLFGGNLFKSAIVHTIHTKKYLQSVSVILYSKVTLELLKPSNCKSWRSRTKDTHIFLIFSSSSRGQDKSCTQWHREMWCVMSPMCDRGFLSPNDHASICALGWIKNEEEQKGKKSDGLGRINKTGQKKNQEMQTTAFLNK